MAAPDTQTRHPAQQTEARSLWPAALCWVIVLIEGFDLVVLGAIIPTLISTKYAGITAASATTIATLSLVGVAIGAAVVGPVTDRVGRRIVLIASIALFSLFTFVIPFASTVALFAGFRLVAGIGLGACLPTALTYMAEHLPPGKRAKASTWTMTGYHVGAVLASLLAVAAIPNWQVLFYLGGAAGFVLLPVIWRKLPESRAFVEARDNPQLKVSVRSLLNAPYAAATISIWVGSFMGLLLVYGLNTWLPKIMNDAGYPVSASITMLLVLNVGAILGLLLAGWAADHLGIKPIVLAWFGAGAVLLALLSVRMGNPLLLNATILVTGVFIFSAQVLIYAYVTHNYPPSVRGTALGLTAAVGRLGAIFGPMVTGALVTAGVAYPWGFYFFAAVAVLGMLALLAVPRRIEVDVAG